MPSNSLHRLRVLSWLPSRSLVLPLNHHHHHHHTPTETGRELSWGSAGSTIGPASPLGKHQAWQFRKAQGWAGKAFTCQKRNEEPLSFGSDPIITTWYRFQGKAAVLCIVSIHGVHTAYMGISVQTFGVTNPDFLSILRVGHIDGKKRQQELDQKEPPLWECERDNGRNKHKPAQGTFITLSWAKEPRA